MNAYPGDLPKATSLARVPHGLRFTKVNTLRLRSTIMAWEVNRVAIPLATTGPATPPRKTR